MNSTRISQAWLKVTESFSMSPNHSWLCGVVVMNPDWESVGCEFKYSDILFFGKKKSSLITSSLILNTKSEKHEWFYIGLFGLSKTSYCDQDSIQLSIISSRIANGCHGVCFGGNYYDWSIWVTWPDGHLMLKLSATWSKTTMASTTDFDFEFQAWVGRHIYEIILYSLSQWKNFFNASW